MKNESTLIHRSKASRRVVLTETIANVLAYLGHTTPAGIAYAVNLVLADPADHLSVSQVSSTLRRSGDRFIQVGETAYWRNITRQDRRVWRVQLVTGASAEDAERLTHDADFMRELRLDPSSFRDLYREKVMVAPVAYDMIAVLTRNERY